jgi:hypothetical protein
MCVVHHVQLQAQDVPPKGRYRSSKAMASRVSPRHVPLNQQQSPSKASQQQFDAAGRESRASQHGPSACDPPTALLAVVAYVQPLLLQLLVRQSIRRQPAQPICCGPACGPTGSTSRPSLLCLVSYAQLKAAGAGQPSCWAEGPQACFGRS